MAIYHYHIEPHTRGKFDAKDRPIIASAAHAVAYIQRSRMYDEYTHTFRSCRHGRDDLVPGSCHTILPPGVQFAGTNQDLWGLFDKAELKSNSRVCRTMDIALPHELSTEIQIATAVKFAEFLAERYGAAVSVAVHKPDKGGDKRNFHAHFVMSTRVISNVGVGEKIRCLDTMTRVNGKPTNIEYFRMREEWAKIANVELKEISLDLSIDHRSNAARGVAKAPTKHIGKNITAHERRVKKETGKTFKSNRRKVAEKQQGEYQDLIDKSKAEVSTPEIEALRREIEAAQIESAQLEAALEDAQKPTARTDGKAAKDIEFDFEAIAKAYSVGNRVEQFSIYEKLSDKINANDTDDNSIVTIGRAFISNKKRREALPKLRPVYDLDGLKSSLRTKYVTQHVIQRIDLEIKRIETKMRGGDLIGLSKNQADLKRLRADRQKPSGTAEYRALNQRFETAFKQHEPKMRAVVDKIGPQWALYEATLVRRDHELRDKFEALGGFDRYNAAKVRVSTIEQSARQAVSQFAKTGLKGGGRATVPATVRASVKSLRECGKTQEEIAHILELDRIAELLHRQAAQNTDHAVKSASETVAAIFGFKGAMAYAQLAETPTTRSENGYRQHIAPDLRTGGEFHARKIAADARNGLRDLPEWDVERGGEASQRGDGPQTAGVLQGPAHSDRRADPVVRRKPKP